MNEYELKQVIYNYVADNFGESEAKDPSWSLEPLAKHVADYFNKKNECNGWSNYATWRVNLELVDGEENAIREDGQVFDTLNDLADHLKQMIDDYFELNLSEIDGNADNFALSQMHDFSDAFLEDVNWREIAENMASDNPEFVKEPK